jgi:hypothetical protein
MVNTSFMPKGPDDPSNKGTFFAVRKIQGFPDFKTWGNTRQDRRHLVAAKVKKLPLLSAPLRGAGKVHRTAADRKGLLKAAVSRCGYAGG